jgi:hypothetical protein
MMRARKVLRDPICMYCGEPSDAYLPIRSNTWYEGMVGTRATLCSTECRNQWDADNLAYLEARNEEATA